VGEFVHSFSYSWSACAPHGYSVSREPRRPGGCHPRIRGVSVVGRRRHGLPAPLGRSILSVPNIIRHYANDCEF
jgi:hypothetical protein